MTSPAPRWLRPFNIFWRIVVAVSLLLGAQDAVGQDATLLRGWRGALMLALILAFAAAYIWFDRNETRQQERWPVPYRTVLLYLIVQLAIVGGLLHFSSSFFGPLLSLLGHVFGALPMRRWWFPAAAIIALLAAPVGIYDAIAERDWGSVFGFVFSLSILIVLAAFVGLMFGEHYRREALIAELRRAKDDLERYATQAEELAALRERTRLAREMHDSLGHALVVVNVKLEAAQRLYARDAARGDAELQATRALVRETMGELRRSLADLRAPLPDHQNLPDALERLASELRARSSIAVTARAPEALAPIPPPAAEALWRVAREALANAERHSGAGSVAIGLERANGTLVLRIADDGAGIAPGALNKPGHYGILGMRERVEALGGALHVGPRPGSGGTLVEARVPLGEEH